MAPAEPLPADVGDACIVILGAGPTGLGAAHRLAELGVANVRVFEKEMYAGGLATSFTDDNGFTWDVGGHVQHSHYEYFDNLMDALLGDGWLTHQRESSVHIRDGFVPYPFQQNIHRLPAQDMERCLAGLIRTWTAPPDSAPRHFEDWIRQTFGDGIAELFMVPYNAKVWAHPPSEMDFQWVGDRVSRVDLERIVLNTINRRDDVGWGPNATFRFPLKGGTGAIWAALAARLPAGCIRYGKAAVGVDTGARRVRFADGTDEGYDILINTTPLDRFVGMSDLADLAGAAAALRHSTVHVVGLGMKGQPPPALSTMCWMYFPEEKAPFYRATVFSRYSPHNVPSPGETWSLMLEVSESETRMPPAPLIDAVLEGCLKTGLIPRKADVVDRWHYVAPYGYPTPALKRDKALAVLLPALEAKGVYSRGRFGAWKYEVANQDHSLMQGVELADRLVEGRAEATLRHPDVVNRIN